jgi:hypothetical protein
VEVQRGAVRWGRDHGGTGKHTRAAWTGRKWEDGGGGMCRGEILSVMMLVCEWHDLVWNSRGKIGRFFGVCHGGQIQHGVVSVCELN